MRPDRPPMPIARQRRRINKESALEHGLRGHAGVRACPLLHCLLSDSPRGLFVMPRHPVRWSTAGMSATPLCFCLSVHAAICPIVHRFCTLLHVDLFVTPRFPVRYVAPRPHLTAHAACPCSLVHVTTGHATGFARWSTPRKPFLYVNPRLFCSLCHAVSSVTPHEAVRTSDGPRLGVRYVTRNLVRYSTPHTGPSHPLCHVGLSDDPRCFVR